MSYILHDCNDEQMLIPITMIRGGTSRDFYFEGKNVPPPGKGLEEFVLAVRGSPDPMGMDGLGGDTILQSKVAIVSPSSHSAPMSTTRSSSSSLINPQASATR
jgi:2-methylaconitate isomerase